MWGGWRTVLRATIREIGDMLIRAISWNIWLERNERIFSAKFRPLSTIIMKIDHMLLLWLSALPVRKRAKFEDSISSIRRSLEFIGSRTETAGASDAGEEISTQSTG